MNKSVISVLKKYSGLDYAETYKPCNKSILEESARLLVDSGHAWSEELTSFYLTTNGFYYDGIYIFPVRSDESEENPDLLLRNVEWNISERLPGCIVFGRSDEEVYVFNQNENKYQILDFTGWDEYYAFESMAELFEFVISERT